MTHSEANIFSPAERELIRREFGQRFGTFPSLAEGIFLRRWRTGPQAGQAKIPKVVAGLIERGLVALSPEPVSILGTRAFFTPAGLDALKVVLQDRRAMWTSPARVDTGLGGDQAAVSSICSGVM
ncbi:hypothetical protein [Paracraurococcus lichenis]|uniref:Transcriptional regulator n=1 Tax=Paracraurococcus lichenis TaxID=3064888 RepID=A0ABT9ECR2_9PROT|nr:hypothetical protein [Paracraurococcus sp. LOR1-02]MDO9713974.1 hypothetical protein [Paracraurococcus sp. LOR1-02]